MNPAAPSSDWLVPDWPAPAGVQALCTTRAGGVSAVPWDSLNLGDHVGDAARAVHENRARLRARMAGAQPVFMRQVHGSDVLVLDGVTTQGLAADACVTLAPGVACTVMVADCLPVLFAHASGAAVAAAHAGWRGLAGTVRAGGRAEGVLESTFVHFASQLERAGVARRADIAGQTLAWLGPCIGPTAFEVGEEVRTALCQGNPDAQRHFQPQPAAGKYLADLAGLARQRLQALGINAIHGNDGTAPWCTVGNPSAFFSHRRDAARLGSSGRFAACIWRDPA
ncbi:peptidoglycan editing factor PgeF [Comamonas endophytica]|uniref:Purine nucleoside phosphorylase n=1 Tax=Comamonas endophytica TaxID=2949090 RepID=A0ABY6GA85_9BURK|nr:MULTISPECIES: peptidoglycan editing factor PgeF [unclassified Acidovorax]MCD2511928.1 peptidoglycan editing factor PgeF [Acidovorax sp. D4N7]UYG51645.1 peptidoglycan editing factor PgeF [Acidovorax sp. 5MLIR]